jgi:hypothetical protein
MRGTLIRLALLPALMLAVALVAAGCEEDARGDVDSPEAREQGRATLEELRTELDRGITPERKERLVARCVEALERLRDADDPQADRLADFCDSLEDTNLNTPAAWEDIRARLDELIARFRG